MALVRKNNVKKQLNTKPKYLESKKNNFIDTNFVEIPNEDREWVTFFNKKYARTKKIGEILDNDKKFSIKEMDKKSARKEKQHLNLKYCNVCGSKFDFDKLNPEGRCKSHNVPKFILKNISSNVNKQNMIATIATVRTHAYMKRYDGANNCDTFKLICRKCDSTKFSEYENYDNLLSFDPSNKLSYMRMLNQISLKIHLMDKYIHSIYSPNNINSEDNNIYLANKKIQHFLTQDKHFDLVYFNKLNYNVGFTVQDRILPNTLVNNIHLQDINYILEKDVNYLYICIYPIGDETLIFMFTEKQHNLYEDYKDYLKKCPENIALRNISYNLLKFTDNIYFNPSIFPISLWSEKDKLLASTEYDFYVSANKHYTSEDYLHLKGVDEKRVTNLFKVNRKDFIL